MRTELSNPAASEGKAKTLFRARGLLHDLIVTRKGKTTTLWSAAGVRHTVFDSAAPHLPGLEYASNMLAVLAFCPDAQSFLVLGLGGASIPRMLLAARPQAEVEAVEIDPAIVELAHRYFDIGALPHFTIYQEEAAAYLERCTSRYDAIVVDTYIDEQFPPQCASREFVWNARKCLPDEGVLAVNWLDGDPQTQQELLKNLQSAVGPVWQLSGLKTRNCLYFAAPRRVGRKAVVSAAAALESELPFRNSLKRLVQRLRPLK